MSLQPDSGDGSPLIHALATNDARQLCAGQLVTDGSVVVKELLENALDASASSVSIMLSKDMSSIVVKDNGGGIPVQGREFIGSAHCTSKLSNFEDVYTVESYGFRGEALHLIADMAETVVGTSILFFYALCVCLETTCASCVRLACSAPPIFVPHTPASLHHLTSPLTSLLGNQNENCD